MIEVNGRKHRESARIPELGLAAERARLHTLPHAPHTAALGTTRLSSFRSMNPMINGAGIAILRDESLSPR